MGSEAERLGLCVYLTRQVTEYRFNLVSLIQNGYYKPLRDSPPYCADDHLILVYNMDCLELPQVNLGIGNA